MDDRFREFLSHYFNLEVGQQIHNDIISIYPEAFITDSQKPIHQQENYKHGYVIKDIGAIDISKRAVIKPIELSVVPIKSHDINTKEDVIRLQQWSNPSIQFKKVASNPYTAGDDTRQLVSFYNGYQTYIRGGEEIEFEVDQEGKVLIHQFNDIDLHPEEKEFLNYILDDNKQTTDRLVFEMTGMTKEEIKDVIDNPEDARTIISKIKTNAQREIDKIKTHQTLFMRSRELIDIAVQSNRSIAEILLDKDPKTIKEKRIQTFFHYQKLGNQTFSDIVLEGFLKTGEDDALYRLGQLVSRQTGLLLLHEDKSNPQAFLRKLRIAIADSESAISVRYPQYKEYQRIQDAFHEMVRKLDEEAKLASSEYIEYVGRPIELQLQEAVQKSEQELFEYMKAQADEIERAEESWQKTIEAIREHDPEGTAKPRKPAVHYRSHLHSLVTNEMNLVQDELWNDISPKLQQANETLKIYTDRMLEAKRDLDRLEQELKQLSPDSTGIEEKEFQKLQSAYAMKHQEWEQYQKIVQDQGWTPSLGISKHELKFFRQVAEGKQVFTAYQKLLEKEASEAKIKQWQTYIGSDERVKLQGSEAGYRVTHVNDHTVTLVQDAIPVKDFTVRLDLSDTDWEDLQKAYQERLDRQYVLPDLDEAINEKLKNPNPFVEIIYDIDKTDPKDIQHLDAYIVQKLQSSEEHILKLRPDLQGRQYINISNEHLQEIFHKTTWEIFQIGDDHPTVSVNNYLKMPKFLVDLMESHAGFIFSNKELGSSMGMEALYTAIQDITQKEMTIDLTDEGIERRWWDAVEEVYGQRTEDMQKEFLKFQERLKTKNVTERLQDYIFLNLLTRIHQLHFDELKRSRDIFAIDLAIEEMKYMPNMAITPENIKFMLSDPRMNKFYQENPRYGEAKKLTVAQIREYLTDSGEESYHIDLHEEEWKLKKFRNLYPLRQAYGVDDPYKIIDALQEEGDTVSDVIGREALSIDPTKHNRVPTTRGLEVLLDVAKMKGLDKIEATVPIEGRTYEAVLYKGSSEILAYIPSMDRTYVVTDSKQAPIAQVTTLEKIVPQYDSSYIREDVVYAGVPKRSPLSGTSYTSMQKYNRYMIPTNPSVTFDEVLNFMKGKSRINYIDIETTGLIGGEIDDRYIQPLEIYSQKIQWDRKTKTLMKNEQGEYVVTQGKGKPRAVLDQHIYVKPTNEVKQFVKELLEKEALEVSNDSSKLWYLRNIAKYSDKSKHYDIHAGNKPLPTTKEEQQAYLNVLKRDVELGLEYLERHGIELGEALHKARTFIGDDVVMGQNVVRADLSTLTRSIPLVTEFNTSRIEELRERLLDDLKIMQAELSDYLHQDGSKGFKIGEVFDADYQRLVHDSMTIDDLITRLERKKHMPLFTADELEAVNRVGQKFEVEHDLGEIFYRQEQTRSLKEMPNFKNTKVIEQMYLSQYLHPDLTSYSAQTMLEHYGISSEGYHLARGDVKVNLELFDRMMVEYSTDDMKRKLLKASRPFKVGDFVQMHTAVDNGLRGLYQIEQMDLDNHRIDLSRFNEDGTKTPFSITAPSTIELNRKFEQNFEFVATPSKATDIRKAVREFDQDNARRAVLRAMDNAFQFDWAEMQGLEQREAGEILREPLQKMATIYQQMIRNEQGDAVVLKPKRIEQRVALLNKDFLSNNTAMDMAVRKQTPIYGKALESTMRFIESEVGQKQGDFLRQVRNLERVGSISKNRANTILKEWNQAIKEKGKELGAKHSVFNQYNLGSFDIIASDTVLGSIENVRLNATSTKSIENSLRYMARRASAFAQGETAEDRFNYALRYYVTGFLSDAGLLRQGDITGNVTIPALVRSIEKNLPTANLAPYEQFDPLKLIDLSKDEDFLAFMDETRERLIGDYERGLSPVQEMKLQDIERQEAHLRKFGLYSPFLHIEGRASDIETPSLDTVGFREKGGTLAGIKTSVLKEELRRLRNLSSLTQTEFDTMNTIASELFYRATDGKNIYNDIDEILSKGEGSAQVQAMEALNWLTRDQEGNLMPNPHIEEHLFGVSGKTAAMPLGEIGTHELDQIASQTYGKFTQGNQYTYIQQKIQAWKEAGYEGHQGNTLSPTFVRKKHDTTARENLAKSMQNIKEQGITRKEHTMTGAPEDFIIEKKIPETLPTDPIPERPQGWIEQKIDMAKQKVRNFATDIGTERGGAARWIVGLGLAAMVLNAFHNAGSPMKIQERPTGHGVEGFGGQTNDDIQSPTAKAPHMPKNVYVSGNDMARGYTIKAKGKIDNSMNHQDLKNRLREEIGDVNINLTDDRTTLNRNWLEEQFSIYLDRGYLD